VVSCPCSPLHYPPPSLPPCTLCRTEISVSMYSRAACSLICIDIRCRGPAGVRACLERTLRLTVWTNKGQSLNMNAFDDYTPASEGHRRRAMTFASLSPSTQLVEYLSISIPRPVSSKAGNWQLKPISPLPFRFACSCLRRPFNEQFDLPCYYSSLWFSCSQLVDRSLSPLSSLLLSQASNPQ